MLQGYVKMLWRSGGSPVWSIIRLWDPLHVAGLQLSRCGWQQSRCLCLQLGLTSLAAVRKTFLRQFILKKPSKAGQMKQGLEMPVFLFLIDRVEFTCSVIVIQQQIWHLTSNLRTVFQFLFSFPPCRYQQICTCHRAEENFENMTGVAFPRLCCLSATKASCFPPSKDVYRDVYR